MRLNPKRGEIWRVDFDPSVGAEQTKIRPALVISRDDVGALPLRVIVPLTSWQPHLSAAWLVIVEAEAGTGLSRRSIADCFQPRSFDLSRFIAKLGATDSTKIEEVARITAQVIGAFDDQ